MFIVPTFRRNYGFFDRQRDMFSDWLDVFDDDWRAMDSAASLRRFEQELDRVRRDMHQLHHVDDEANRQLTLSEPFVTDPEGNKKLSLRFDCSKYKPEEVQVQVKDDTLSVHAKHEEKSDSGTVRREFHRMFTIPEGVDKGQLKATLAADGLLAVEAPMPQSIEAPKDVMIPIERLENKDKPELTQK